MGRIRKKVEKPWCWYCNRKFENHEILVQHQKAKHFKCAICYKKMFSGPGLWNHCKLVHSKKLEKVPNALPNRDDITLNIVGMAGIPLSNSTENKSQEQEDSDSDSDKPLSKKTKLENVNNITTYGKLADATRVNFTPNTFPGPVFHSNVFAAMPPGVVQPRMPQLDMNYFVPMTNGHGPIHNSFLPIPQFPMLANSTFHNFSASNSSTIVPLNPNKINLENMGLEPNEKLMHSSEDMSLEEIRAHRRGYSKNNPSITNSFSSAINHPFHIMPPMPNLIDPSKFIRMPPPPPLSPHFPTQRMAYYGSPPFHKNFQKKF